MSDFYVIEEWDPRHPRWGELDTVIESLGQTNWARCQADWHHSSVMLVALSEGTVVGFLRFVLQAIGVDDDLPPVSWMGVPLIEAKILAFGVAEASRRLGIGRALQEAAIRRAADLGCHQVRSHSSGDNVANHALKLSLGFGVHPIVRGSDKRGVYFILPLRCKPPGTDER